MTSIRSVILAALAFVALTACDRLGPEPSPIPTPLHRVVQIDQAKVAEGVISYGVERGSPAYGASVSDTPKLHTDADLRLLKGAPEDFKAYIVRQIDDQEQSVMAELALELKTVETEECDFVAEIRVWGIAPHVATGRVRGCDQPSFDVIWVKDNDRWRRASRMQGGWDCAELRRYRVPADITAATCWYDVFKTRPYDGPDR
jgi:hypothetical protein